ncbi:hypothetical protein HDU98_008823 [Podochytrium sp. JEL0797]|nr:hypothetical protein HDU98_008823 [Podochytrium sp. JEL0797]
MALSPPHPAFMNFAHDFLQDKDSLRLVLAGAASGLGKCSLIKLSRMQNPNVTHSVSAAMVTPLDVVKIRLQNQSHLNPKYKGTFPTLAKIWTQEGVHGLFSGLAPSVYAYLPDRIIWFSVYHGAKRVLAKELGTEPEGTTTVHLLATLVASVAGTVAVSPLWFVRTRMMAQTTLPGEPHSYNYTSTSNALSTIVRKEGWGALYKGLGPSLLGVSHSLIMFPLYERLKLELRNSKQFHGTNPDGSLTNGSILIASSISKCIASLATYPHEVIRTRLQTQTTHNYVEKGPGGQEVTKVEPKYRGVIQTAKVLIREEGAVSLYRGLGTSIIRQVPAGAINDLIILLLLRRVSRPLSDSHDTAFVHVRFFRGADACFDPHCAAYDAIALFAETLQVVALVGLVAALAYQTSKAAADAPLVSGAGDATPRFVLWMQTRGLRHDGAEIVEPEPGNRDVVATKPFNTNDIVMTVPHALTIHDSLARKDPVVAKYLEAFPKTEWVPIIAAYVILQRTSEEWEPYLSFLPRVFWTPLYWTEDELKVLKGTDLEFDLVEMRAGIQTEWSQWKEYLPLGTTYADFLWAWHIVMSRVWILPVADLTNTAVLIPMVDVANHFGQPKVKIEYNKEMGAVTMTATQAIQVGEQIDVTYGSDSTYKSLKYMGFTLEKNDQNEDCRIRLIRGPEDNFPRPKKWCLFQTNKLDKTIQSCHMGNPMTKETLLRVRNHVVDKLMQYPTSIKTDNMLLKKVKEEAGAGVAAGVSRNFVNGVRERRGEKVCLSRVRRQLDALLKGK